MLWSYCLVILSQTEIFESTHVSRGQIRSPASSRTEMLSGLLLYLAVKVNTHLDPFKHCRFRFTSVDWQITPLALSLFSLIAPQKESFSRTNSAGLRSGLPVCTSLHLSAIILNETSWSPAESDSGRGICVLMVVFSTFKILVTVVLSVIPVLLDYTA